MKVLLSFCIFLVPILAAPLESKLDDSVFLGDDAPTFSGKYCSLSPTPPKHVKEAWILRLKVEIKCKNVSLCKMRKL